MNQRETYQATLDLLRQEWDGRRVERDRTKLEFEKKERECEKAEAAHLSLTRFLDAPEEGTAECVPASHEATYANMGLTAAILHELDSTSTAPTAAAIRTALVEGGYPNQNLKNLYASIYSTLDRLRKRGHVTKDSEGRWKKVTDAESQPLLPASATRVLAEVLAGTENEE